jgi:hypothetical protein
LDISSDAVQATVMTRLIHLLMIPALLGWLAGGTVEAAAKTYEQPSAFLARHFGGAPKARVLTLSGAQQKQLASILGHKYGQQKVRYWAEGGKSAWILDEVGKTEPMTTGFIVRGGKLVEVKVLIYRESHGWEVSRPFFTKQFEGASLDGNRLSKSVDGVVGATLSVRAITKLSAAALYLSQQSGN